MVENPVIDRVAFEGNKKVKDEQLYGRNPVEGRAGRCRGRWCSPTRRVFEIYRRSGRYDVRVEPKIIELPNNRVDLVFEITEGAKTGVKRSTSSAITPIRPTV